MNLAAFGHILSTKSLHFTRVDQLEDQFEGSLTRLTREEMVWKASDDADAKDTLAFLSRLRRQGAVNCWHMNQRESAAMWKLYISGAEGICIQSTPAKLTAAFPLGSRERARGSAKVFIGSVGYLDYDDELISDARAFWPHMYKRRSFEHERELRVVLDVAKPRGKRSNELPEEGVDLRVDLGRLIEGIYVAPTSPGWFLRVVQSIVRRYGFSFRVRRSGLSKKPLL